MRLDLYIAQKYNYSRNKAQAFIADGLVSIDAIVCQKSAQEVSEEDIISIRESREREWVSRSAGKLVWLLETIWVNTLAWKSCLDIGSSTGGFTQILLAYGTSRVTAVDVGTDQLHPSIRSDARVVSHENTDIRTFTPAETYDVITIDVSFISLREIVPVLPRFAKADTDIYLLYKPQFEVWKNNLRKTWVPRDEKIVAKTLTEFQGFLMTSGYRVRHLMKAAVVGEAGNQEYMMWIRADRE
jgi:23S rRNA (cytidine1920-2'-O)/16S rRNA (cytidine1409-2'-O)-methyltransferase